MRARKLGRKLHSQVKDAMRWEANTNYNGANGYRTISELICGHVIEASYTDGNLDLKVVKAEEYIKEQLDMAEGNREEGDERTPWQVIKDDLKRFDKEMET